MKKHTPKRPPRRRAPKFGTAPTMRAAQSRLSLKRFETVQAAKNAACPAFKERGSVDCDVLHHWLHRIHPEILEVFEELPNIAEEEALAMQSDRRTKDAKLFRMLQALAPVEQLRRVLIAFAKRFTGRLYALPARFALEFAIPEEKTRAHLDPILKDLTRDEIEKLIKDIDRNAK